MYFKQSDFFTGMAHGFVKDIMANVEKIACAAGDIIFQAGDETRYFYILIKGHVKLSIDREGRTVFVINRAGECFGWSSLIDRPHFSASAVCAAPTSLMRLEKTKLRRIIQSDPYNGLIFMERIAGMIGDRLLNCYRTLSSSAQLSLHSTEGTGQVQETLELA
jgi:CRP-like cAMP-binding protein